MVRICVRVVKCFQVKCIMAWHHCKISAFSKNQSWWMLKQWKGMRTLRLSNRSILITETMLSQARCDHIPDREFYKKWSKTTWKHITTRSPGQGGEGLFTKQEQKWLEGGHWSGPMEPPSGRLDNRHIIRITFVKFSDHSVCIQWLLRSWMIVRSRLEVEVGVREAVWSNITNLSVIWDWGVK